MQPARPSLPLRPQAIDGWDGGQVPDVALRGGQTRASELRAAGSCCQRSGLSLSASEPQSAPGLNGMLIDEARGASLFVDGYPHAFKVLSADRTLTDVVDDSRGCARAAGDNRESDRSPRCHAD